MDTSHYVMKFFKD